MNDLREDRELSERFMDLRREEAAQTPPYARMRAAVRPTHPLARRGLWHAVAAGGLAAGVALCLLGSALLQRALLPPMSGSPSSATVVNSYRYVVPTDVLLEPPGGDLWGTLPALGCLDPALSCALTAPPSGPAQDSQLLLRMDG